MKKISKKLKVPLLVWVYSAQDTGKTSLMRKIVESLYPMCQKFVVHRVAVSDFADEEGYCLFRNHRFAFATDGDTPKQVASHINKFYRLKPDVVLLTARKGFSIWNTPQKMGKYLNVHAANWLKLCAVVELPRLIRGKCKIGRERDEVLIGLNSDDMFLFLTRMIKYGLPKKWPSGNGGLLLSGYVWEV